MYEVWDQYVTVIIISDLKKKEKKRKLTHRDNEDASSSVFCSMNHAVTILFQPTALVKSFIVVNTQLVLEDGS